MEKLYAILIALAIILIIEIMDNMRRRRHMLTYSKGLTDDQARALLEYAAGKPAPERGPDCLSDETITLLLEGNVDEAVRKKAVEHLSSCVACILRLKPTTQGFRQRAMPDCPNPQILFLFTENRLDDEWRKEILHHTSNILCMRCMNFIRQLRDMKLKQNE